MNIAVLTLTRDRLPYTQHCFQTLKENAGCDYDHYVLDQASDDGTVEWLNEQDDLDVTFASENIGINAGLNHLLNEIDLKSYDVVVKFDNDCELLTEDTLTDVCDLALDADMILSPRIHGLRNPPRVIGNQWGVDLTHVIGGIFMATPAYVFKGGYRHRERGVGMWGSDDADLCRHFGKCGYVRGYHANHYLTTDGQHKDIPDYFARTLAEGKPSIL